MALVVKRESLSLYDEERGHETTWDYLTVYDKEGNILKRSSGNHFEGEIRLEYDGLIYVSPPGSRKEILITYDSILQKFEKNE